MNILFISSFFPPCAPTAATRIGKLTRYFHERGHGVCVLTARNTRFPAVLPVEVPEDLVTYVPYPEINDLPGRVRRLLPRRSDEGAKEDTASETPPPARAEGDGGMTGRLRAAYETLTNIPDSYIEWYRPAVAAGLDIVAEFRPDWIYVSVPLHTGLLAAARLSEKTGVPLIVEYRDLWVEHPYYDAPAWRRVLERRLERRATRRAKAYVTVTEGWAELLTERRGRPTELVLNGFDPADFSGAGPRTDSEDDRLTVVYAGALYEGKRDPTPLFKALQALGPEARQIRVTFHTPDPDALLAKIEAHGLTGIVESLGPIPHAQVIALEERSDVLLLLRWDHPSEETVLAGKLFEYIGAGRPILSVGLETGEAADIINQNGFGLVTREPGVIAAQLRSWLAEKRAGGVPETAPERRLSFSRAAQFERLEGFLNSLKR